MSPGPVKEQVNSPVLASTARPWTYQAAEEAVYWRQQTGVNLLAMASLFLKTIWAARFCSLRVTSKIWRMVSCLRF